MNNIQKYEEARALMREAEQQVRRDVSNRIGHFAYLTEVILGKKLGDPYEWRNDLSLMKRLDRYLGVWGLLVVLPFQIDEMREGKVLVSNARTREIGDRSGYSGRISQALVPQVKRGMIEIPVELFSMNDREFCAMIRRGIKRLKEDNRTRHLEALKIRLDDLEKELENHREQVEKTRKLYEDEKLRLRAREEKAVTREERPRAWRDNSK